MAEDKTTYPTIPTRSWWILRQKFNQTIPVTISPTYLASVLNVTEESARANVWSSLQRIGIIDEDGKTQNRAREWRDDMSYPEVCSTIVKEVYPTELVEAVTDPKDRETAQRWFSQRTGFGVSATRRLTSFFLLLLEAEPQNTPLAKAKGAKEPPAKIRPKRPKAKTAKVMQSKQDNKQYVDENAPNVYINLQIHVSSEATSEQIDKIFESMAKHIYQKS